MELLVQRDHLFVDVLLAHDLLLAGLCFVLVLATSLVRQHEELCNLVGILARSRNLDRASPVEVEVAECKRQRLNFQLAQIGVVLGNVEVGGQYATLGGVGRCQEEVEHTFTLDSIVLNQLLVNNAA